MLWCKATYVGYAPHREVDHGVAMALSGALHGRLILVRRLLGPPVPPPVCGVTALINTTTIKQMLYIICNDKTVIYIF